MTLDDLPTPCLVLDLAVLKRNLALMQAAVARFPGLVLRPHMKTAKSVEVAKLAAPIWPDHRQHAGRGTVLRRGRLA